MTSEADLAREVFISNVLTAIPLAIILYDYILTFEKEVKYFWPPRNGLGWVSSVFLINRYLSLLGHLPILVSMVRVNRGEFCTKISTYHEFYEVILQVFVGILCMMRVYALYQRNRWVLGFLVVIAIASVSMACWSILSDKGGSGKQIFIDRYVGCDQIFPDDGAKHYAVAWGGVLMFDTVVFLLTVYRGYKYRRAGRLVIVLMRDGAFYFIVLFLTNLANIFMFLFAPPSLKAASTTFTNVLSAVLITRLMINLKESASPGALPTLDTTMSFDTSGVDTAPFTTIMGDQDAYSLGPWTRGGYSAACPPEEAPRVRWCDGDDIELVARHRWDAESGIEVVKGHTPS